MHAGLPRTSPSEQGVSARAVLDFLDAVGDRGIGLHSLMLARHGSVVAEGWWTPYRAESSHQLHSLMKIFLSTATGIAVGEGRFSVNDRVVDIFPAEVPADSDPRLSRVTVGHLLTGTTGQAGGPIVPERPLPPEEHVRWFFSIPFVDDPGGVFRYSPPASIMLSAVIEKTTGMPLPDYIRPRLLDPLGIAEPAWTRPWPPWPFGARTEDLVKLGMLHLDGGRWGGLQILSAGWVSEAIAQHVDTDHDAGYGYQFWQWGHGTYGISGAFGQYSLVIPEHDTVVGITAETGHEDPLGPVWAYLLPGVRGEHAPDPSADRELAERLASLALPTPRVDRPGGTSWPSGATEILLEPNDLGIARIGIELGDDTVSVSAEHEGGRSEIVCGVGRWVEGVTDLPGMPPQLDYVGDIAPVVVNAAAGWSESGALELQWRFTETAHGATVRCRRSGDVVRVEVSGSYPGSRSWILEGRLRTG